MSEQDRAAPVEESPVWEAADRLRHYGFGHLAELVEELVRERAKRPDREQFKADAALWSFLDESGFVDDRAERAYLAGVDAVLASFPNEHEAREVTDAEVEAALVGYGYLPRDLNFDPGVRMRAALEAAREVPRG